MGISDIIGVHSLECLCVLLFVGCGNSEAALIFTFLLRKVIAMTIEEMAMLTIRAVARELEDIIHTVLALDDACQVFL